MWAITTMLFYSAMQNSSKTWQRKWQKVDKIKTISSKTMFKDSSLRTNTSSNYVFAPLINSQAMLTVDCSRPHQTSISLCFSSLMVWIFLCIHDAAWHHRSRNQLDWDLDCLEATNLEKWRLVFLDTEPPQFHANIHSHTSELVLQGNVATKLSYSGKFLIHVMSHFFLIPTLKEF